MNFGEVLVFAGSNHGRVFEGTADIRVLSASVTVKLLVSENATKPVSLPCRIHDHVGQQVGMLGKIGLRGS